MGPRSPREFVLGGGLWRRIAWTGALIALVTLGVGWWSYSGGGAWQSSTFLTLGLAQLGVAIALRRRTARRGAAHRGSARRGARRRDGARGGGWRPRFLDVAVAGAVLLQLAGIYLSPLRALLGTELVGPTELAVAIVAALLPGTVVAATRLRGRAAGRRSGI